MSIYLIGSLRNPNVVKVTKKLTEAGLEVFSEWYGAGEKADDAFKEYHKALGRTYVEALKTDAAKTIFEFDKSHIDDADTVILVAPAGKSGHLELGYALGCGKRGYYLLDDPDRWDLMLQFCTGLYTNLDDLIKELTCTPTNQTSSTSDSHSMPVRPAMIQAQRLVRSLWGQIKASFQ